MHVTGRNEERFERQEQRIVPSGSSDRAELQGSSTCDSVDPFRTPRSLFPCLSFLPGRWRSDQAASIADGRRPQWKVDSGSLPLEAALH
ncbi:uncharacterized protein SPSK_06713 [Sporothrix schenckii 1099-18]|uniref:Uncharacterized protein n=1 Tax=Sporothrix schenckii 1099-18 TaxID=1397361 RepID=A0A0F2MHZ2_SPOSC|nr:uncharacterized protein SPSK_06713 [Sporothrix schenckii 1099-18]KJR89252.1 hypothetical protein SPSK_06713 [Sporothrix schenckii 1099-18]